MVSALFALRAHLEPGIRLGSVRTAAVVELTNNGRNPARSLANHYGSDKPAYRNVKIKRLRPGKEVVRRPAGRRVYEITSAIKVASGSSASQRSPEERCE